MLFLKKNAIYIIIILLVGGLFLVPKLREMLIPVAEVKDYVKIEDSDLDLKLKGINTPDVNLKDLRKGKTLFLNFWGTWCPPCVKEWPSIEALFRRKPKNVQMILIAMQDDEIRLKEFIKKNNYTAPVYVSESPIGEKLLPKVFPTTLVLDQFGSIIIKEESSRDWNTNNIFEMLQNISEK